jgi:FAD/FMN-containing dehydrogenase
MNAPFRTIEPGDPRYDTARAGWNLEVDQRPAEIVVAADAADVARAVRAAHDRGLGVAVQATGHGISRACDGGILVLTRELDEVEIDPAARAARVGAGALWRGVVTAAAPHGLAALAGSSPGVGVVGYTLGGGFGWLGRRYGLASHHVTRAEVVVATGETVVASPGDDADLFWGLLGGTGNFGIVTALEFRLHPVTDVYAGNLYYPLSRARDVLDAFADWTREAPADLTGAAAFRRFPPLPSVPGELRGQSLVALRGCWSGDVEAGATFVDLARRRLGPALVDTFRSMPVSALASLSMDPLDPLGAVQHCEMVPEISPGLVDALLGLVGPGTDHPLVMLELRTLGGALAGPEGALSPMAHTHAVASVNAIGATTTPFARPERVRSFLHEVAIRLRPHVTGETYVNFLDLDGATPDRVRAAYSDADWQRLVRLKTRLDPHDRFRFNRAVPTTRPSVRDHAEGVLQ